MRYGFLRGAVALLLSAGLLLTACSEDDETGGPTGTTFTAEELNDMGWDALSAGDHEDAVSYFEQALEKAASLHEARLGLGWGLTQTGSYEDAVAAFDAVIAAGVYAADAQAGRAVAALESDPTLAVSAASAALSIDAEFASEWIEGFDHLDLHLIMAEAYFALAQYSDAQVQVDLLDPENELNPQDLEYVTDLALAIEALRELVAG